MSQTKYLVIIVTIICLLSLNPVSAKVTDTFTGTGDKTTTTFTITKYAKIDWSYVKENDYDLFSAYLYEPGNDIFKDSIGGAETGSSYFYKSGTYYFDVTSANINSWTITTTETTGEYLANQDTIAGSYSKNSKLFKSYGNTEITWSYIKENDYDLFNVYIYQIGKSFFVDNFDGESGTTQFYKTGEFYLAITSANIASYTINLNVKNSATSNTQSSSTSQTTDQNSNNPTPSITKSNITTSDKTANYEILAILAIIPFSYKKLNNRRK